MFRSAFFGFPVWTGWSIVNPPAKDLAFQLTEKPTCNVSIDVEKEVWDPCHEEWVDADTENESLDLPICTNATFKITIHNDGECADITDIFVYDRMHESLEYISADPQPDDTMEDPPYLYLVWYGLGPLAPCETIEIIVTAHVVGPNCSTDENYAYAEGLVQFPPFYVWDEDWAWVHAYVNKPPTKPDIKVPTGKIKAGTKYYYEFHSTDPNGDPICYVIDWGDGNTTTTTCYPSCTPANVSYTYAQNKKFGTTDYTIKAKAFDCCWGAESGWAEADISVPRNKLINSLFMRFLESIFERFPNAFPILRNILF
jgi:hypothetical protein